MPGWNPRYPEIHVPIAREGGNAFGIVGRCLAAMHIAGIPKAQCDRFVAEAAASESNGVLRVCTEWVDVD